MKEQQQEVQDYQRMVPTISYLAIILIMKLQETGVAVRYSDANYFMVARSLHGTALHHTLYCT